jgi:hypothetical protein
MSLTYRGSSEKERRPAVRSQRSSFVGFCPGPCGRSRGGGKRSGTTPMTINGGTGVRECPCRIGNRYVFFGLKVARGWDEMAAV